MYDVYESITYLPDDILLFVYNNVRHTVSIQQTMFQFKSIIEKNMCKYIEVVQTQNIRISIV